MIQITQAEHDGLVAGSMRGADVAAAARNLVAEDARQGVVLTIEQEPLQPLAMGHYETIVSVRPARAKG